VRLGELTQELEKALRELSSWWLSETQEFRNLVVSLLCGLPGADEEYQLSERFVTTDYNCGWKEIDLIGNLLAAVNTEADAEEASKAILKIEKEQEE